MFSATEQFLEQRLQPPRITVIVVRKHWSGNAEMCQQPLAAPRVFGSNQIDVSKHLCGARGE